VGTRSVTRVSGHLVPVDDRLPVDETIERRVARMQRALERDPQYAPLFQPIARLAQPMSVEQLGERTLAIMRDSAHADVAVSTASSFRQSLPSGVVTLEDLRNAMPYDNEIVVVEMSGAAAKTPRREQRTGAARGDGNQPTANSQRPTLPRRRHRLSR